MSKQILKRYKYDIRVEKPLQYPTIHRKFLLIKEPFNQVMKVHGEQNEASHVPHQHYEEETHQHKEIEGKD